jgi:DNA-binding MarR family transcriptional regulator
MQLSKLQTQIMDKLRHEAKEGSRCVISYRKLAESLFYSIRSICRAVDALESKGYIERTLRSSQDSGCLSNCYEILKDHRVR